MLFFFRCFSPSLHFFCNMYTFLSIIHSRFSPLLLAWRNPGYRARRVLHCCPECHVTSDRRRLLRSAIVLISLSFWSHFVNNINDLDGVEAFLGVSLPLLHVSSFCFSVFRRSQRGASITTVQQSRGNKQGLFHINNNKLATAAEVKRSEERWKDC